MKISTEFIVDKKAIGPNHPTYFIADIAANHDGNLERAKELIHLAAEAGADAAKFQHFAAKSIVSDQGFKSLGGQQSHQTNWKKSVFEVYQDASINTDWTAALRDTCRKAGITFFTSPYSFELVDHVDPFVAAYKVGSGDITWHAIIEHMAKKKKPLFVATGASTMDEVDLAISAALRFTSDVAIMQCNTNYTASLENFRHIQLGVLKAYREMYPGMVLGLSDHTPGHATVLGAVSLGARVVEKHFTDDNARGGPDHKFSMDRRSWREMVDRTRELEQALGTAVKKVEANERETVILQRRALRFTRSLPAGTVLAAEHLFPLRPCPADALPPFRLDEIIGQVLRVDAKAGEYLRWGDLSKRSSDRPASESKSA